jgi:aryl-alcohol dehydrogenase-like predicted oxidoreductase
MGAAAAGGFTLSDSHAGIGGDVSSLPTRPLGKTGVPVTVLALGGYTGMKEPRTEQFDPVCLADAAIDAGVRYFDTAPSYGNGQSERHFGEVLAHRRDDVFLAGKTGKRTYDEAMREFESSLQRLRTDNVDLLQIHGARANEDVAAWGKPNGVFTALERLRDEKVVRFLGVTGHESTQTLCQAISMYDFDTVLTTFNPMATRRAYQEKLLPLANKKQMGIQAMKVMGGELGSLAIGNPAKNDGKPHHDDAVQQASPGTLIRYVLGLPISTAVVGMGSLEELRVNVAAVRDDKPLNGNQRQQLQARMNGEPG